MDSILRAAVIYFFILAFIRLTGKRTLSQLTTFDFVLLLIIGESTQQALLGEDFSLTNALLVILTLLGLESALSLLKQKSLKLDKILDGVPVVLVDHGRPLVERLKRTRLDESDILAAARETQGLERMEQIKYAVLERDGKISVIPRRT
ncbi:MAG: DUF421 domain-containing protein [Deltaproteobacteria bacterium]|nr:DUF421 domain-containing protein [Deltaproteobacteria bacterium]